MLRHFREKAEPLAIDREVSRLFTTRRQPIPREVERRGLQIVGIANDTQHRATSAGNHTGFDLFAVRHYRPVGPDTEVGFYQRGQRTGRGMAYLSQLPPEPAEWQNSCQILPK